MISSQAVGSIVGMKSDEISKIANEYLQQQAVLEQETNDLKAGKTGGSGAQTHKRQINALEKAIGTEKEKLEKVCFYCYFTSPSFFFCNRISISVLQFRLMYISI